MRTLYGISFAMCIAAWPLLADQNDPALVDLFEALRSTEDQQQGRSLTRQIWNIWHDIDDPDVAALLSSGVAMMRAGLHGGALHAFGRVVDMAPDFAEGWNKRATVLYLLGRGDESMADIRRTLELEPRHFGALSGLGLILLERGSYQAALIAFRNAREVNPYMPGVEENIARTLRLIESNTI